MTRDSIFVKGARENNLKNIDVSIPRDRLVVITGPSGSGKSSLAFDTIYAEGQRRYVESLSAYARQFLGQMDKPDIDYIEGLSPAISIDQRTTSKNPRSTVGTVTEIHDYLRLLYARIGIPHCPVCGREISAQTIDQVVDRLMAMEAGTRMLLLAPIVRSRKGEYGKLLEDIKKDGFNRVRVDGTVHEVGDEIKLTKTKKHTIDIVVDRVSIGDGMRQRLSESLEVCFAKGGGLAIAALSDGADVMFSKDYSCPECGVNVEELAPRMFSFNNPYGACQTCSGLGVLLKVDTEMIFFDREKSLAEGAYLLGPELQKNEGNWYSQILTALSKEYGFDINRPIKDMPDDIMQVILYGTQGKTFKVDYVNSYGGRKEYDWSFEGLAARVERMYKQADDIGKVQLEPFMSDKACPDCGGSRLRKESLAVTVCGRNVHEVSVMTIREARDFFTGLRLGGRDLIIANQIMKEIVARLGFLVDVGLDYLTLSRSAGTLSGGEAQRIRLATQIGSGLMGVLYILDEPSIGLHQRDNGRLLRTLHRLRDLGNTLLVVEHDEDTMYAADHIIDIGPGAGVHGGNVVAEGRIDDIKGCGESLTGLYLSGARRIEVPSARRRPGKDWILIRGARENNLKGIDVRIPTGVFTCVTGVSGSGKSSLVNEILYKKLAAELNRARLRAGSHDSIEGMGHLDKVIDIDQSPIGRTPRSNPLTYTGVFDFIRQLYASTNDAKVRGFGPGRFSFNVRGGRCEACHGDGIIKIEMHFLPDVYVPCEVCGGKRYNRETLEVRYKGKNISEILDMTVESAYAFFSSIPRIHTKISTLYDVGLGYLRLGQSSTTLSGGEAQRVKLAAELSRRSTGKTMYILDEPTTGLHVSDVHKLVDILQKLTDSGNTVVVIEHNLDVIKTADYVVDLGPEGGDMGGRVVFCGTPEELAEAGEISYTGKHLRRALGLS
ncbi:MAG: excinuclease ABC subunit UvrA [Oscillospiraceae bacterium]|nr:excinuclease ABC subunit UvrA [Oscillospiraceae bacterium]